MVCSELPPPELIVGYLLAAPHSIVNEVVVNEPVLSKAVIKPVMMYRPVLEMLVGDLIMSGQLVLVRRLVVVRQLMLVLGVGEMLSMVCKMVRLSRRGAVRM